MLLPLMLPCVAVAQGPVIDPALASRYFQEAKAFADRDGGRLWGRRLDGPMLFVDPSTRATVTNRKPPFEGFARAGEAWVGTLPPDLMIANTAIPIKGERWSMIMWPLSAAPAERANLMAHELFHRIQEGLGLPPAIVRNEHLDTKDGRLWLRAEISALRQALVTPPRSRHTPLEDALIFRTYRQSLFPEAKKGEDRMELHEGLAEYTGVMMRGTTPAVRRADLARRMLRFGNRRSFPSSFAYETGPAYGLLLDDLERGKPAWNRGVSPDSSLAGRVAMGISFRSPDNLRAIAVRQAGRYGYETLLKEEVKREDIRLATEKRYRAALVDGPVLVLPLGQMNFTYDPNGVFPLGPLGTVYPESTIGDAWGKIVVTKGVLMSPDFKRAVVPAPPAGDPTRAEGWKLELRTGWRLVPGKRSGDWTVAKE